MHIPYTIAATLILGDLIGGALLCDTLIGDFIPLIHSCLRSVGWIIYLYLTA